MYTITKRTIQLYRGTSMWKRLETFRVNCLIPQIPFYALRIGIHIIERGVRIRAAKNNNCLYLILYFTLCFATELKINVTKTEN